MDTQELIFMEELVRVIGFTALVAELCQANDAATSDKVQTCARVLKDEWDSQAWTEQSVNGATLIALYS